MAKKLNIALKILFAGYPVGLGKRNEIKWNRLQMAAIIAQITRKARERKRKKTYAPAKCM